MTQYTSFRKSLSRFATGVTVITCSDKDGKHCGITANSFSSVSLDPPLILWNIAKVSNSLSAYLAAEFFAVNVLREDQEALSRHFARTDHRLFDDIPHSVSDRGAPLLIDPLAVFECRTVEVHDCGDHYIIIGEVLEHRHTDGEPLLFYDGRYRTF